MDARDGMHGRDREVEALKHIARCERAGHLEERVGLGEAGRVHPDDGSALLRRAAAARQVARVRAAWTVSDLHGGGDERGHRRAEHEVRDRPAAESESEEFLHDQETILKFKFSLRTKVV